MEENTENYQSINDFALEHNLVVDINKINMIEHLAYKISGKLSVKVGRLYYNNTDTVNIYRKDILERAFAEALDEHRNGVYKVELLKYPTQEDWKGVKDRALVTVGKKAVNPPTIEWEKKILKARHSPIRYLQFSFYLEIPYYVSVHLVRHVHAQPYVRSQRNDRQNDYDRNAARQDAMVSMIWDINAEELAVIANKRLCSQAAAETRTIVQAMCDSVKEVCPEFADELVPMCEREHGCNEMYPCGRWKEN